MVKLTVRKNRVGPVLGRHPWVFSGALQQIPEGLQTGETVVLVDENGKFVAQGYFNSYSQIAVRLWSWDESEEVNDAFFEKRSLQALQLREQYIANPKGAPSVQTDSYRLVHSENDFLPGLIVDKYADYLSLQFHNRGIEWWKDHIMRALEKIVKPKGIYERSDVRDRKRFSNVIPSEARADEGSLLGSNVTGISLRQLAERNDNRGGNVGLLYGDMPDRVKIKENGYLFWVDVKGGQKTGFFLDQRDKRKALEKYVNSKTVLNCFSYTGGFSVYALGGGAKRVVNVDASEPALALAEENVRLNKFDETKAEFITGDVKQYLTSLSSPNLPLERGEAASPPRRGGDKEGEAFDVIVLDPPAFVKDRHKVKEGLQGYRKINELALRLLQPGGILVTCSCSAHVSLTDFRHTLTEAAARARKNVQILETFTHGIDHPELAAFTEGEYLKCLVARVS